MRIGAIVGAALGATVAGVGMRIVVLARQRGMTPGAALQQMPELLADDVQRVSAAAQGALADAREAQQRAEAEIEQVLQRSRRTNGSDG